MPRVRKNSEKVLLVRTDIEGNVIDYDIVDPSEVNKPRAPVSAVSQQPRGPIAPIYRTKPKKTNDVSPRSYEPTPPNKANQTPRRARYVPKKSDIKIFEQKVTWHGKPRITTRNDEAMSQIRYTPREKIFDEKLSWNVRTKIDTHNEEKAEAIRRFPKPRIHDQPEFYVVQPKVDTNNENLIDVIRRAPKKTIRDEKLFWKANPKIDTHNEQAVEELQNFAPPKIYDRKLTWSSPTRIDQRNVEYVEYKQRDQLMREKSTHKRIKSHPHEPRIKTARIDNQNPEFLKYQKQKQTMSLPPIVDEKLHWKKKARINQHNDDYIERIRQKRSEPMIFREKTDWITNAPKVDDRNDAYVQHHKDDQPRTKIVNQLPRWKAQPKIATHNEDYDPDREPDLRPVIVDEKPRWNARPKIDTGLEQSSDLPMNNNQ